jgi:integrase
VAKTLRDTNLGSREARSKLKARHKPYYRLIDPGLHLGYYKPKGRKGKPASSGTWSSRTYLGAQSYKEEKIGTADDYGDADGLATFSFAQAQAVAREHMAAHARKADKVDGPMPAVRTAIEEYIADRDARETRRRGRPIRSDAHRLTRYVIGREQRGKRKAIAPTELADVPLAALDEDRLREWRDALPAEMKESSKRRTINDLKAALNAGYEKHRKKHKLVSALPAIIKHGLKANGQHDDEAEPQARDNQILSDAQVTRVLRAAKQVDAEENWDGDLYRMVVVLAASGTRFSQARRLQVGDCQIDRRRLMIPKSRKGRGKSGSTPVPVEQDVIQALVPAVTGRAKDAPLLERWRHRQVPGGIEWERGERGPWQSASELARPWEAIRERAKMPEIIPYSLRHSAVVRGLKANLPVRLVAALHDTSVPMIERHYAKWVAHGLEDLAAQALVPLLPREDGRVVPLRRPRKRE